MELKSMHHIAIIASNYEKSKKFYTELLGFEIIKETYREARGSYKLDLKINDGAQIELFSFPNPPKRLSNPEATGLRHLAFSSNDIEVVKAELASEGIETEEIRIDETTGKRFFFFQDPDNLPIEIYENMA